jgi:maleate isomerase
MRIGIIFTPDAANDRDFWRWCPPDVHLLMTRTPLDPAWLDVPDDADPSIWAPSDEHLREAVHSLIMTEPAVITYACTSCSFCGADDNDRRIRQAMTTAGAAIAQTASSSVLDALRALEATSIAVGTPYQDNVTAVLGAFLERNGVRVTSLLNVMPAPGKAEQDLTREQIFDLADRADRPDADAFFLSCTALQTFDLIADLEEHLGKPVVTASQATIWAALGAAGAGNVDANQMLLSRPWTPRTDG